jgi:hypothetical protein
MLTQTGTGLLAFILIGGLVFDPISRMLGF